jgi:hypothetical protein
MLGGDLDYFGPGSLAVQGLWPVLWGRYLRDVTGAGDFEIPLARWANRNLAVEGPRPAFRVGKQPYGLLPTSSFNAWVDAPGDALSPVETRILEWALPWRARAAAAARAAHGRTTDEDVSGFLDVLGLHAPSRHWEVRAVADLYDLQGLRTWLGMPPLDTTWDDNTARALRKFPSPLAPVGPAPGQSPIPGPPVDEVDDASRLKDLCTMEPEELWRLQDKLGLVGHLFREALVAARAIVGDAVVRLRAGAPSHRAKASRGRTKTPIAAPSSKARTWRLMNYARAPTRMAAWSPNASRTSRKRSPCSQTCGRRCRRPCSARCWRRSTRRRSASIPG